MTTKRYFAVVVALQPELMLANWIIYEKRGKWRLGSDAELSSPLTWREEAGAGDAPAVPSPGS